MTPNDILAFCCCFVCGCVFFFHPCCYPVRATTTPANRETLQRDVLMHAWMLILCASRSFILCPAILHRKRKIKHKTHRNKNTSLYICCIYIKIVKITYFLDRTSRKSFRFSCGRLFWLHLIYLSSRAANAVRVLHPEKTNKKRTPCRGEILQDTYLN